jgi:hypothetical protein
VSIVGSSSVGTLHEFGEMLASRFRSRSDIQSSPTSDRFQRLREVYGARPGSSALGIGWESSTEAGPSALNAVNHEEPTDRRAVS